MLYLFALHTKPLLYLLILSKYFWVVLTQFKVYLYTHIAHNSIQHLHNFLKFKFSYVIMTYTIHISLKNYNIKVERKWIKTGFKSDTYVHSKSIYIDFHLFNTMYNNVMWFDKTELRDSNLQWRIFNITRSSIKSIKWLCVFPIKFKVFSVIFYIKLISNKHDNIRAYIIAFLP